MLTGTVKEAAAMGADGVSLHINIGGKEEPEMLEQLGMTADQCHKWGMPLLAMMYPRGENIKDPHDPEIVGHVPACPIFLIRPYHLLALSARVRADITISTRFTWT